MVGYIGLVAERRRMNEQLQIKESTGFLYTRRRCVCGQMTCACVTRATKERAATSAASGRPQRTFLRAIAHSCVQMSVTNSGVNL
jgi:hypothetical protein